MYDDVVTAFIVVGIAGSGVVAGIFFAFSTFVMRALKQLPDSEGISAMQRINITVINPLFMLAFLGTPAVCVYLLITAAIDLDRNGSGYLIAGSILHLVGTFFVTLAFNVPRNNALAKVDPNSESSSATWSKYLSEWTMWNHIRTIASLGSTVLLSLAVLWN